MDLLNRIPHPFIILGEGITHRFMKYLIQYIFLASLKFVRLNIGDFVVNPVCWKALYCR